MVYKIQEAPTNWHMIALAVVVFALLFALGIIIDRIKYRIKR